MSVFLVVASEVEWLDQMVKDLPNVLEITTVLKHCKQYDVNKPTYLVSS